MQRPNKTTLKTNQVQKKTCGSFLLKNQLNNVNRKYDGLQGKKNCEHVNGFSYIELI